MARNYKELQARMDPASRADNKRRVREELQRMALEELRGARQLTQADMAEMLDVPQSSISRIEQRADMYLSTLRNYIHAVGGELRIQAVFPDGGAVLINRFGEYEERPMWSTPWPRAAIYSGCARVPSITRVSLSQLGTSKFPDLQKPCVPYIYRKLRSRALRRVCKLAPAGSRRSVEVSQESSAFSPSRTW